MKKTLMIVVLIVASGCGPDGDFTATEPTTEVTPTCEANVTGQLTLVNDATQVQKVMLNGVDYGKVNTGSSIDVDLPPGEYSLQFNWIDGSEACMPATVNVSVCSTQTLTCTG